MSSAACNADPPPGMQFKVEDFTENFKWPEYIVFVAVLIASLGIGVFYGCFGSKSKSNEEFLMAGRSMSITPVTLSLVCSFVSAVTLLGNPVEVYYYGQVYTLIAIAFIPMTLTLMYWYVPVFFHLQLTSAYEYMEWRYSRLVRTLCSIFGLIHLTFYQPITVLGPALAIDQVAGFNYIISAAAIFFVCIGYSSLGGLKAVLWTDALQACVMFAALASVSICGLIEVGGISRAWSLSEDTDRTNVLVWDPDPRVRHTVWSAIIGGFFVWLPLFAATQAQIQRYNSVPTLRQSRQCLLFNMCGMICVILLCSFLGMLAFAKYHDCNPMKSGAVTSADQLLPLFVMDALRDYPVIPGLLVAGITCGSLSTVSSALNSFTCLITEDFIKYYKPEWNDVKLGYASKAVSTISGIVAFGLLFAVKAANETINLSPFSTLIHGSLLGPVLGVFSLGMFLPWSNNLGVFLGMCVSILISGFVGLGNIIAGREGKVPEAEQRLQLCTNGCETEPISRFFRKNMTHGYNMISDYMEKEGPSIMAYSGWKEAHKDDSWALKVWSLSYIWQPGIGCVTTLIFGILFSYIIIALKKHPKEKVHTSLLSKPWLSLWEKIFGKESMSNWVDYGEVETFRQKTARKGDLSKKVDTATDMNLNITAKQLADPELNMKDFEYGTVSIPKAKLDNANVASPD